MEEGKEVESDNDYERISTERSRADYQLHGKRSTHKYEGLQGFQANFQNGVTDDHEYEVNTTPKTERYSRPPTLLVPDSNEIGGHQDGDIAMYVSIKGVGPKPIIKTTDEEGVEAYDDVYKPAEQKNHVSDCQRRRVYTDGNVRYIDGTMILKQVQQEPYQHMVSQCGDTVDGTEKAPVKVSRKAPRLLIFFLCLCFLFTIGVIAVLVLHLTDVLKGYKDYSDQIDNLKRRIDKLEMAFNRSQSTKT